MITGRYFYISAKVGCFIDHQGVVCDCLLSKRLVFTRIMSFVLGLNIQKTGGTVISKNLVSIIVISHCQFIKMSMAQTV